MTKDEAIDRINTNIQKKGLHNVVSSPKLVRYWWSVINKALFDEQLSTPFLITICDFDGEHLAWFVPVDGFEKISIITFSDCELTRIQFFTTLIHEMVHQYTWETIGTVDHDDDFYDWESPVKELFNLPLAEYVV